MPWYLDTDKDAILELADDAQIFAGRYLIFASSQSRAIQIYDLDQRHIVFAKYGLVRGDLLKQALLSPDGKLVLQINSDGSFVGYRTADAKELFQGRYVDDEVVVWTPDGHFDATPEGAHYVSLRLPGRVGTYTFEQFSARLKTPGLVGRLLAGETFPPVTLVAPPSLRGTLGTKDGRVQGAARAVGDNPVRSLLIYQDGQLTDRLDVARTDGAWKFDVDLLKGTRWVSMVAVDTMGLASLPMGRELDRTPKSRRRVRVLAIGVDKYSDPRIPNLQLARSDAQHFVKAVANIGRDVVVTSSLVLGDKEATRARVLAALS